MQRGTVQVPRATGLHRRQDLFKMMHVRRRDRTRTQHAVGRLQMHFHRSQRRSVRAVDRQHRREFITVIVRLRQLRLIAFGDMSPIAQLRPIMHQHHDASSRREQLLPSVFSQRLTQLRHLDARIVVKPPSGHRLGKRRHPAGKTGTPRRSTGHRIEMPPREFSTTFHQPLILQTYFNSIQRWITQLRQ